jgi:hypothetical protein
MPVAITRRTTMPIPVPVQAHPVYVPAVQPQQVVQVQLAVSQQPRAVMATPVSVKVAAGQQQQFVLQHGATFSTMSAVPTFASNCTGKKRALLIGINYFGQQGELNGSISAVKALQPFLMSRYNFAQNDILLLVDDHDDDKLLPTRKNMLTAMRWLVHDAQPHDSLFFYFAGHGGRVKDLKNEEVDVFDSTILPMDHRMMGEIVDNVPLPLQHSVV